MSATLEQIDTAAMVALVRQVAIDVSPDREITGSSRFVEDIGMESVTRLMLMTLVEQESGISLEKHLAALVELQTIEETVAFIRSLQTGG